MFGIDGVLLALIITFIILFGAILSGFPVAFAIGGAGVLSFSVVALLDSSGLLTHTIVDVTSPEYKALLLDGISRLEISKFSYPDLPRITEPVFPGGWEKAVNRTLSFVVNRVNERVIAGQSIETLLAILMFVLMGITLEKSNIANDLLTSMARVFGGLPGGLAVSVVVVGAFLAASTGIVGATVVTMGLLSLPTMLRNKYSPQLATGVISASGTLGQIIPPSIVIIILGTLASVPRIMITIDGGIICPSVPDAEMTPVANCGEYLFRSMVGNDSSPIVTTVAPTIPVEAARKAPTTTTDTARPPGRPPKTRAMDVSRSFAIFDFSSVIPIRTNIRMARSVSIDWPAITRSFTRLTTKDNVLLTAFSHPPGNTGSVIRGKSG